MRHGWDTETRVRPVRYDEVEILADYELRKDDVETRVEEVKTLGISDSVGTLIGEGETFPSTDIDIGADAINRFNRTDDSETWIDNTNPANDTGSLDTFQVYFSVDARAMKIGTFSGSSLSYTSRDFETLGDILDGALREFTGLDCDVESGDFIGGYWTAGRLEMTSYNVSGDCFSKSGDQFGAGAQTYTQKNAS